MVSQPSSEPSGAARRTLDDGAEETLVREEPLSIEVAGERVLTMRTPGADRDLVTGFLLSEGVIVAADQISDLAFEPGDAQALRPDRAVVTLRSKAGPTPTGRLTRTHEIRASCGLCGLVNPDELLDALPALLPGVPRLTVDAVQAIRSAFEPTQTLFAATGSSHGAGIYGPNGELWGSGEDVGRHNALDKALGAAAARGHELAQGIAMLSGRAGFDLAIKCLRMRVAVILSVSAATAQTFDLCRAAGATLVGFVRPGRMRVYLDGGRLG